MLNKSETSIEYIFDKSKSLPKCMKITSHVRQLRQPMSAVFSQICSHIFGENSEIMTKKYRLYHPNHTFSIRIMDLTLFPFKN